MLKTRIAVAAVLLMACPVLAVAQKPATVARKASVVHLDKAVDFAKFRTYSYQVGHPAILKDVDDRIVAGIEAQLKQLGLTRAESGPGDVTVTYYSVTRTDVDLATFDKAEPAQGTERKPAQTFKVGTLVVDVKAGDRATPAWRAKVEGALEGDAAAQMKTVDEAVVAAFRLYPTRTATIK